MLADETHLVLEQVPQRLGELQFHVVGKPADVVVALDAGRHVAARFDHVGVQRALHQEVRVAEGTRLGLEDAYEQLADDAPLRLRLDDAGERCEEARRGIHVHQAAVAAEGLAHLPALARTHQPGVDENAGEAVTDGSAHEGSGDRRVDAS